MMPVKPENFIGRTFGRLVVLEYAGIVNGNSCWSCLCDCGTTCIVQHANLRRGSTNSCGCLRREKAQANLHGHVFGKLTVMEKASYKQWRCKCECGNDQYVATSNLLKSGRAKSCGCSQYDGSKRIIDLTGKKFGEIEVLHLHEKKGRDWYWMCKCSCGTVKPIMGHHLRSGSQKSCGCRSRGWKHGMWQKSRKNYNKWRRQTCPWLKIRGNFSTMVRRQLFNRGYKKRKSMTDCLPYTIGELKLHLESLWEPWMNWDNYGGNPNDERKTWHIDHIKPQSSFQYTSMDDQSFLECWALSNLRPLEKMANIRKGNRLD